MAMLPLAALLGSVALWPEGPERVATGWSGWNPDSFTDGATLFSVTLSIAGVCAIGAAVAAVMAAFISAGAVRWLVAVLSGVAAGAAGTYLVLAVGSQWRGAEQVTAAWQMGVALLALGWAVLTHRVYGRHVPPLPEQLARIPERDRVQAIRGKSGTGAREWRGASASATLRGGAIFAAVVLGACTVLLFVGGQVLGAVLAGVLTVLVPGYALAWSRIEVRVDRDGLRLFSAVVPGLRLVRLRAEGIIGVQAITLEPMRWGGHGLRPTPGRMAYIAQGGPGLVVHRDTAQVWAVEVTDGDVASAARTLRLVAGQARVAASSPLSAEGSASAS